MKKYVVVIGLLFALACTSQKSSEETPSAANIEIAKKMFAAFNQHDWELMASYYSEDATFLDPSYGKEYVSKTRRELVQKYREMEAVAPDIHDELINLYADNNTVIVEFISSGTAPNGTKWQLPICSILTIENGKIVKDATYFDS